MKKEPESAIDAFARLEAKIDRLQRGATWQQFAVIMIAGILVSIGLNFGVLAYANDAFDGGASVGAEGE